MTSFAYMIVIRTKTGGERNYIIYLQHAKTFYQYNIKMNIVRSCPCYSCYTITYPSVFISRTFSGREHSWNFFMTSRYRFCRINWSPRSVAYSVEWRLLRFWCRNQSIVLYSNLVYNGSINTD